MKRLAVFILFIILPSLRILSQWNNGQSAEYVIGQNNFSSNTAGVTSSTFNSPYDVAIDLTNMKMYVADLANHRVLRFSYPITGNQPVAELVFGQPDMTSNKPNRNSTVQANSLMYPTAVAVRGGVLWICDQGNNRILKFNNAATLTNNGPNADGVLGQADFVSSGSNTAANKFKNPYDITFDDYGNLWVADMQNNRVLRFDSIDGKGNGANADAVLGQLNFTTSTSATSQTGLKNPSGVVLYKRYLFVVDMGNNRVLRYTNATIKPNGGTADGVLGQINFLSGASNRGGAAGQNTMSMPIKAEIDGSARLYVADQGNNRMLIYTYPHVSSNGLNAFKVLGQSNFTTTTAGTTQSNMNLTNGSAIDFQNNKLIFADEGNNRLLQFSSVTDLIYYDPESVVYDSQTERYLISSTGDGSIYARDKNGKVTYFNQGGSTSIRGLTIYNNKLYAACDEGVNVYDLATGQKSSSIALPGGVFPNDIESDGAGNIFVSDDGAHKIYKVVLSTQTASEYTNMGADSPNGIYFDKVNNRLIVVFWQNNSPIKAINLSNGSISTIKSTTLSLLDGITADSQGNYYISSGGTGSIYKFDNSFSADPVNFSSGHIAPADIYFNQHKNELAVPEMGASKLTIIPLVIAGIIVVKPNGSEIWRVGTSQNIQWTSTGITNVKIDYSTNSGTNWIEIVSSTNASGGTYAWTIPNTISSNCLVRVSDAGNTTLNDQSNSVFTIEAQPTITVVKPNGGEIWRVGTTQNIQWTSTGVSDVKIEYSTNNGTNWTEVISKTSAASGSYTWTVPNTPSSNCLVKVSDFSFAALNDQSNAAFTIEALPSITVTKPNGGEVWRVGSTQYIMWTSINVTDVKIEYSTDNGATWIEIISKTSAAAGSFTWIIPNTVSSNCLVRVSDFSNPAVSGKNNSTFTINPNPSITVVKPNGGEIWDVGTKQNIQWTSINVADVKIEYSINSGTSWTEVVSKTNAAISIYSWTVPNTASKNCLVKISDAADANTKDQSDVAFTIQVPVSVSEEAVPAEYYLYQNYPNPFNPSTIINYQLSDAGFTVLKIFDSVGRDIATLVNEYQSPGYYSFKVSIHQLKLTTGIYFYRLTSGKFSGTKKLMILK